MARAAHSQASAACRTATTGSAGDDRTDVLERRASNLTQFCFSSGAPLRTPARLAALAACAAASLAAPGHAKAAPGLPRHNLNFQSIVHRIAVFDRDDRRLIAQRFPNLRSRIGLLVNHQTNSVCTAFCVAPDIVATAGHCASGTGSQSAPHPSQLSFRRDDRRVEAVRIYGSGRSAARQHILTGAPTLKTRPPINATSDWAFLRLTKNACPAGGLALSSLTAEEVAAEAAIGNVYHVAYHRDLAHWKLAIARSCRLIPKKGAGDPRQLAHDFERSTDLLLHTCDTEAASSGSPLLIDGDNGPEVVGINVGTYVRSRVISHDGKIVQRLGSQVISNTALLASPLIPQLDAFARAEILTDRAEIRRLQQHLGMLGLSPGPADGLFGSLTRRAIKLYQARAGLPENGLPTSSLLKRLDTTAGTTASR